MLNKSILLDVMNTTLEDINPKNLITNACSYKDNILTINNEEIVIPKDKKIYVFGSGKAVQSMAESIYSILENKIEKMFLVGPYEQEFDMKNVKYLQSSHPLPSQKSVTAAIKITEELKKLSNDDIFIYLLSGGNSALVEMPADNISLKDFELATSLMLKASMPIEAINCVRKHISLVKGGGLCNYTEAKGHILVLSDVMGDNFEDIGSAPFYYDKTMFQDAYDYLKKYKSFNDLPVSIKEHIIKGIDKKIPDTLKEESKNIKHYIIGSNTVFLKNIEHQLLQKDIPSIVYESSIKDDVEVVCKKFLDFCQTGEKGCFIFGGEATVLVTGEGKGGRNQHLVLRFLEQFPKNNDILFLSIASDGIDGNSTAAGAIVDRSTLDEVNKCTLDMTKYSQNFDSNSFLREIGALVEPGPTHNNMLDAVVIYIK